ncbi:MAG: hypothetical protein NTY86_21785 [Deltaproteobacteria bacterium]|nr:hypothetical protein [Deltaproteobacteria bacterium]
MTALRPPAFFLPPALRGSRLPVVGNRICCQHGCVFYDVVIIHGGTFISFFPLYPAFNSPMLTIGSWNHNFVTCNTYNYSKRRREKL